MPTKERLRARAEAEQLLDLRSAAERAGYASESLRKMIWSKTPPPLFKYRGRWHARAAELDAWIAERDGLAS